MNYLSPFLIKGYVVHLVIIFPISPYAWCFSASSGNDVLQLDSDSTNAIFDYEPTLGTLCNEFILNIVVQDDNSVDGTALNSSNYTLTVIVLNKEEVPWFNEDGNLA